VHDTDRHEVSVQEVAAHGDPGASQEEEEDSGADGQDARADQHSEQTPTDRFSVRGEGGHRDRRHDDDEGQDRCPGDC
jgi:hypothetical protein